MLSILLVLLAAAALAAAVVSARMAPGRSWPPVACGGAAALAAAVVAGAPWLVPARPAEADVTTRPHVVAADGYAGSSACRACHPQEYDTWHASYHRSMTQAVTPQSVLADWQGVTLTERGKTWRLERRGDEFWVDMDDPVAPAGGAAPRVQRRIALSTGSHNMQVYWFETGYTRVLGLLPFSWQVAERRWISRLESFVQPADDPVNLGLGVWNLNCIKCHATHARPRADWDDTGMHDADTQVADLGVACEACHGPGAAHIDGHRNPATRYAQRARGGDDPTMLDPRDLPYDRATMVCGQCHGLWDYLMPDTASLRKWFDNGFPFRPGDDANRTRRLKHDGEGQFWSDGLPRVAGREYSALVGSGCYEKGHMSCMSCHELHPHDARPRAQWADDQLHADGGEQSCLQCHPKYGTDVAAHTHHAPTSTGSRCMNCHMPHTTYGLMKGVRTHRIQSPSVASTLATGRPNACNECHLDRTLAWTAQQLGAWYGKPQPTVSGDDANVAAGVLWALKGDAAQRALVAWNLGQPDPRAAAGSDWMAPLLAELLDDPYGAVRIIAERSLRTLPGVAGVAIDGRADAAARKVQKQALLAAWRAAPSPAGTSRAALLLRADGSLDADEFARLLRRRDLRTVRLEE